MPAKIRATGFVAINHNSRVPYIMTWSTRPLASQVKDAVVENWPDQNCGGRLSWDDIRRKGISVAKIKIETAKVVPAR